MTYKVNIEMLKADINFLKVVEFKIWERTNILSQSEKKKKPRRYEW